jgi:carboxypeptidase Taq
MAATENRAYRTLSDRFGSAGRLYAARMTLFWDSQTNMPRTGAWARGEEFGAIDSAQQDLIAAPE